MAPLKKIILTIFDISYIYIHFRNSRENSLKSIARVDR